MQQQWIISWSDCDVWWKVPFRWQPAQWLDQEEAPKHFPKPNLHQKIGVMVSVWWSDARLIHYSFLNPGETITSEKYAQQTSERHEKLQRLLLALGNRIEPILLHNNAWPRHIMNMSQVQWIEQSSKFCLICHIHLTSRQLTTTSSSISSTFCRENASTTRRMQKMLSKSSSNPEAWFLCYRNKQTYFLLAKMCWLQWFLFCLIKTSLLSARSCLSLIDFDALYSIQANSDGLFCLGKVSSSCFMLFLPWITLSWHM